MGLVILIFVGIIGGSIFWVIHTNRVARAKTDAARAWPVTTGTVTRSVLNRRITETRVARTYYCPGIHYAYAVGGQTYEGNRLSFGDIETIDAQAAEAMRARFPEGATVEVRYDPQNPAESVLGAMLVQAVGR